MVDGHMSQTRPKKRNAIVTALQIGFAKRDIRRELLLNIWYEQLKAVYDNCLEMLNKYKITGQTKGMAKLIFHLDCIEKERRKLSSDR